VSARRDLYDAFIGPEFVARQLHDGFAAIWPLIAAVRTGVLRVDRRRHDWRIPMLSPGRLLLIGDAVPGDGPGAFDMSSLARRLASAHAVTFWVNGPDCGDRLYIAAGNVIIETHTPRHQAWFGFANAAADPKADFFHIMPAGFDPNADPLALARPEGSA